MRRKVVPIDQAGQGPGVGFCMVADNAAFKLRMIDAGLLHCRNEPRLAFDRPERSRAEQHPPALSDAERLAAGLTIGGSYVRARCGHIDSVADDRETSRRAISPIQSQRTLRNEHDHRCGVKSLIRPERDSRIYSFAKPVSDGVDRLVLADAPDRRQPQPTGEVDGRKRRQRARQNDIEAPGGPSSNAV